MGEVDFEGSGPSLTVDDVAEVLYDSIHDRGFMMDGQSRLHEAQLDSSGSLNLTLTNGQTFRITVEHDDLERSGT